MKPYDPEVAPAAPKAPIYVGMMAYMPEYDMGQIYFCLPTVDVNDNLLDTNNLYYNFIVNGEIETLYTDEYQGLTEEITDIPWAFTDDYWDVYGEGVYRYFTFRIADYDYLGIQSFYLTESGEKLYSGIMKVYPDGTSETTSGILSVANDNGEAVSVELYDLQGRQVIAPAAGTLVIQKTCFADGTTKCEKRIVR